MSTTFAILSRRHLGRRLNVSKCHRHILNVVDISQMSTQLLNVYAVTKINVYAVTKCNVDAVTKCRRHLPCTDRDI